MANEDIEHLRRELETIRERESERARARERERERESERLLRLSPEASEASQSLKRALREP